MAANRVTPVVRTLLNSDRALRPGRRSLVALGVLVLLPMFVFGLAVANPDGDVEGVVLSKDIMLSSAGPLGAVTVVGDSVLLGAGLWSPTLPDQLQAYGWGPIRFRAGVGDKAGPTGSTSTAGWWIEAWRREGWDAANVIVNLGANDSALCRTDVACSRRRILDVVEVIGPDHRIWWPMITRESRQRSGRGGVERCTRPDRCRAGRLLHVGLAAGDGLRWLREHRQHAPRRRRISEAFAADGCRVHRRPRTREAGGWRRCTPRTDGVCRASSCHSTRSEWSTRVTTHQAGDLMAPSSRWTSAVGSRPERRRSRSM